MCICVFLCGFVHEYSAEEDQKRTSDPLELEFQADVSCPAWARGLKLESFVKSWALIHQATFSDPIMSVLLTCNGVLYGK